MTRACGYVKNVDITYFSVESEKKKKKQISIQNYPNVQISQYCPPAFSKTLLSFDLQLLNLEYYNWSLKWLEG